VQLDRIHDDTLVSDAFDRPLDLAGIAGKFYVDPPGLLAYIGAPDVGIDFGELSIDPAEDRFLDLFLRKPEMKAQVRHHRVPLLHPPALESAERDSSAPPAMAGTIEIWSPSVRGVSLPFMKRISSSLR